MARGVAPLLTAAHAELAADGAEAGVYVAWLHPGDAAPYEFLLGGRPGLPALASASDEPAAGREQPILFPPGATGTPIRPGTATQRLAEFPYWVRCLGTVVARSDAAGRPPDPVGEENPGQGFDDYVAHLRAPYAWVVVAQPQDDEVLDEATAELAVELTMLRKREHSEDARLALERGQTRYRELTRARRTGLWSLSVLAGGTTPVGVRQAAALLCGAGDLDDLSWSMLPGREVGDLAAVWAKQQDGPDASHSPFLVSTDTAARLTRGPARELPGIRLVTPPDFDVTPDAEVAAGAGISLGAVLDAGLQPVGEFVVPYDTLNRHGFVCGATGSGKSQTSRRLLESLATGERPVPWLVVEPAKAEYARMSGRLAGRAGVLVIRPGDPATVPASINPLEPEPGFPLQSHADLVRALFLAAFEANEPFPQVLSRALTECYTAAGWDLVTSELRRTVRPKLLRDEPDRRVNPRYPTLGDLQATARRVVDDIGYGKEVAADVRGFVDVRMGSLRDGTPGRFFEGGHPLDIAALLERNVVIELESITNDQDKAFLMGTVLIRIVEHLRVRTQQRGEPDGLRHVLLIEEAHRLLKNVEDGPAAAAVELFASLLAEIRAYGEGVVVVEQIPAKILPDVIKNTALKIMHRLPAKDDREAVGATMNLQESGHESVVAFGPGQAAVTVDGWDRPLLARMAGGAGRETADGCETYPPLRGRRSGLCGPDCQARACELHEMAAAAGAAGDPYPTIWVELVAASVVMGVDPPHPRPDVLAGWPGDSRLRSCALAMAVETATGARRAWLGRWVDPEDFAARLHVTLAALLAGAPPPDGDVRRWRAGAFRWASVHGQLEAAIAHVGGADEAREYQPHPETADWMEQGLILDADNLADQFQQLLRDPAYAHGAERVALGDVRGSGLLAAVNRIAGASGPSWFEQAIRLTCTGGALDLLIEQLRDQLAEVPATH
jgi:DNA helicase HerA-like ATPase